MFKKLGDLNSDDPEIQERARMFNYIYVGSTCDSNIYEAFNSLINRGLNQTLRTAYILRNTFKLMGLTAEEINNGEFGTKTGFLTVDINIKVKFLWRAHFLEVLSLNPNKPLFFFSQKDDGVNYLGLQWERGKPSKADPLYDVFDQDETGEEYLMREFKNRTHVGVSFKDGFCTIDPYELTWQCVQCMILEDPNEKIPFLSILNELIPQIVPDVVILYIKFAMTKPKESNDDKKKYNMVKNKLGINYDTLDDDTRLYNKSVIQYIQKRLKQSSFNRGDLLPTGRIGAILAAKKLRKSN